MTIEELKQHCIKTIRMSEAIESIPNVKITDSRSLQEHKMVLKLIEAWEKVKEEIKNEEIRNDDGILISQVTHTWKVIEIIDKHLSEVSE